MAEAAHDLARAFVAGLCAGGIPEELLTPDFTAWTTTSGVLEGPTYLGGIRMLATLFAEPPVYAIDTLTAEADRVAIEAHANGMLVNGQTFANTYVFMLRLRDGRIARVAEHFNPAPVTEKILPLLQAAMRARPTTA